MRIIGHVPHPSFKITLLEHNDRFTIQVEAGAYSQHYRFRRIPGLEDARELAGLVDEAFLDEIRMVFDSMHANLLGRLKKVQEDSAM